MTLFLFVIGLVMLVAGAESLVRGAARLAATIGISPIIIGLTVVSFATSSPELAVGIQAGLRGEADIVVGNVIGSNIFNVLFVLGLAALFAPLIVERRLIRFDVPVMIGISILAWLMALDGQIGRAEGFLLFAGVVAYTFWCIRHSRQEKDTVHIEQIEGIGDIQKVTRQPWVMHVGFIVGGLVLLTLGSRWLVDGAIAFAEYLGVSELIIGLTIVAIGTSLPEVATSVAASLHGERDIAVGNIVGSNIFNLLAVLGAVGLIAPNGINITPAAIQFNIPVMIGVALACLPIFITGRIVTRWEGAILFGYYLAYTLYLILAETHNSILPIFSGIMLFVVIPFTIALFWAALAPDVQARRDDSRVV